MYLLTDEELMLVAGGGDIYVYGHPDPDPGMPDPQDGDPYDGLGGGGGGGSSDPNHEEYQFHDRDDCKNGEALHVGNQIKSLQNSVTNQYGNTGHVELGGIMVQGSDGLYGLTDDGIQTSHNDSYATLSLPSDKSSVVGIIHNHPYDSSGTNINYINMYPSVDDWNHLDQLVQSGANPAKLSFYVVDPFGTTREFKYTDEAKYKALSDADKVRGDELPQAAVDCTP